MRNLQGIEAEALQDTLLQSLKSERTNRKNMSSVKEHTYYKKEGRKYVPIKYYEPQGFGPGLWYIKEGNWRSMDYYCRTHKIVNAGRWADIYATHGAKLSKAIGDAISGWISEKGKYSVAELVDIVCNVVANLEDDQESAEF